MLWEKLFILRKYNFVSTKLSLGVSTRSYAYLEQKKVCANLPCSASEAFKFMMMGLNFSEILTGGLSNLGKVIENVT